MVKLELSWIYLGTQKLGKENTLSAVGKKEHLKKSEVFQTLQKQWKTLSCIYCREAAHKKSKSQKDVLQKRNTLNKMKLCYNSCGQDHGAIDCRSKWTCQHYKGKQHTST